MAENRVTKVGVEAMRERTYAVSSARITKVGVEAMRQGTYGAARCQVTKVGIEVMALPAAPAGSGARAYAIIIG